MEFDRNSVLIVSRDEQFTKEMSDLLSADLNATVTSKPANFQKLNGSASAFAFQNDIVIFDSDPNDAEENRALCELLESQPHETVFVAMTGNEISLLQVRAMQGIGVDQILPRSIDGGELTEILQKAIQSRRKPIEIPSGAPHNGTLISVARARGGVGATALAVNLARSLARRKSTFRKARTNRVALVDFDLQFGDAHVFLDIEDNGAMDHLITSGDTPDNAYVNNMLQTHSSGLKVLTAPAKIFPLEALTPKLVENLLRCLKSQFDYVVVDLPRPVVEWLEPLLVQSDRTLLVTDSSVPSVRQARRLLDLYRETHVGLSVELIVNFEKRPMFRTQHLKDAEGALDAKFGHWIPDNPKVARNAVDLGRPVVESGANSNLGKAYRKIADAVLADFPVTAQIQKGA